MVNFLKHQFYLNNGFTIRQFLKSRDFFHKRALIKDKYKDSFLLRTTMKSGSNFLCSLIGNYVFNIYNGSTPKRLDHNELKKKFWSSNNFLIKPFNHNPTYKYFIFEHDFECNHKIAFNSKKIINLYRNPLDFSVSMFYFDFINREKTISNKKRFEIYKNVNHPRDMLEILLPGFLESFKHTFDMVSKPNALNIQYEELVRETDKTLKKVIDFLELPLDEEIVSLAINYSSISKLKSDEKKYASDSPLSGTDMKKVSFVRSGKIGEWEDYFSPKEFDEFLKEISKSGVSPENFIFR